MKMRSIAMMVCIASSFFCIQWTSQKSNELKLPKKMKKQWAYIPAGIVVFDRDTSQVDEFYMSLCEVSNAEYRAFIQALGMDTAEGRTFQVDSAVWTRTTEYGEPFKVHYYRHPAYNEYPVVGITYEGAVAYCNWQQQEVQKQLGGGYQVTCKIPSRQEFIRAARGDKHTYVYAWGGPYLANNQGHRLCNYSCLGDESISIPIGQKVADVHPSVMMGVAGRLSDNADITAPIHAYVPNEFGCYNLNGNVAELIEDGKYAVGGSWRNSGYDVRCESILPVEGPTTYVGFRTMLRIKRLS